MKSSPSQNKLNRLLREFVESDSRNAWLSTAELEVYVRKGRHSVDGVIYEKVIEIANVNVKPAFQGKGRFTSLLESVKIICADFDVLLIENVLTEEFEKFFIKNSWVKIKNYEAFGYWPPSYYLKLKL